MTCLGMGMGIGNGNEDISIIGHENEELCKFGMGMWIILIIINGSYRLNKMFNRT